MIPAMILLVFMGFLIQYLFDLPRPNTATHTRKSSDLEPTQTTPATPGTVATALIEMRKALESQTQALDDVSNQVRVWKLSLCRRLSKIEDDGDRHEKQLGRLGFESMSAQKRGRLIEEKLDSQSSKIAMELLADIRERDTARRASETNKDRETHRVMAQLQKTITEMLAELREVVAENRTTKGTLTRLTTQLKSNEQNNVRLHEALDGTVVMMKELDAELDTSHRHNACLQTQIAILETRSDEQRDQWKVQDNALLKQIQELEAKNRDYKNLLLSHRKKVSQMKEDLAAEKRAHRDTKKALGTRERVLHAPFTTVEAITPPETQKSASSPPRPDAISAVEHTTEIGSSVANPLVNLPAAIWNEPAVCWDGRTDHAVEPTTADTQHLAIETGIKKFDTTTTYTPPLQSKNEAETDIERNTSLGLCRTGLSTGAQSSDILMTIHAIPGDVQRDAVNDSTISVHSTADDVESVDTNSELSPARSSESTKCSNFVKSVGDAATHSPHFPLKTITGGITREADGKCTTKDRSSNSDDPTDDANGTNCKLEFNPRASDIHEATDKEVKHRLFMFCGSSTPEDRPASNDNVPAIIFASTSSRTGHASSMNPLPLPVRHIKKPRSLLTNTALTDGGSSISSSSSIVKSDLKTPGAWVDRNDEMEVSVPVPCDNASAGSQDVSTSMGCETTTIASEGTASIGTEIVSDHMEDGMDVDPSPALTFHSTTLMSTTVTTATEEDTSILNAPSESSYNSLFDGSSRLLEGADAEMEVDGNVADTSMTFGEEVPNHSPLLPCTDARLLNPDFGGVSIPNPAESMYPLARSDPTHPVSHESASNEETISNHAILAEVLSSRSTQVLDDDWEPCWDTDSGKWYFFNKITRVSQWDNPRASSGAQPDAAILPDEVTRGSLVQGTTSALSAQRETTPMENLSPSAPHELSNKYSEQYLIALRAHMVGDLFFRPTFVFEGDTSRDWVDALQQWNQGAEIDFELEGSSITAPWTRDHLEDVMLGFFEECVWKGIVLQTFEDVDDQEAEYREKWMAEVSRFVNDTPPSTYEGGENSDIADPTKQVPASVAQGVLTKYTKAPFLVRWRHHVIQRENWPEPLKLFIPDNEEATLKFQKEATKGINLLCRQAGVNMKMALDVLSYEQMALVARKFFAVEIWPKIVEIAGGKAEEKERLAYEKEFLENFEEYMSKNAPDA
ncbi:unnamed protein product [Discula destructiva]